MPPRRSLFSSGQVRNRVIAAIMAALLLASLSAAYAFTRHRLAQNAPVELVPVEIGDLRLRLPETWATQPLPDLPPDVLGQRLVDTRRPTRTLTILRLTSTEPVHGLQVMNRVLPRLWPEGVEDTLETAGSQQVIRPEIGLAVVEWVGASRDDGDSVLVHMAADLTRDSRVHWLLYLADRVPKGENAHAVLQSNLGLLRGVLHSARIEEPQMNTDGHG